MARRRRVTWSPTSLPTIRTVLADAIDGWSARFPDDGLPAAEYGSTAWLRHLADDARDAELYWVSRDMARLAQAGSQDIPPWTPVAVVPDPVGLLVWDTPDLPTVPVVIGVHPQTWPLSATGIAYEPVVPVVGILWAVRDGTLHITALGRGLDVDQAMGRTAVPHGAALWPVVWGALPIDVDADRGSTDGPGDGAWLMGLLAATWLMMGQPTLADTRRAASGDGVGRDCVRDVDVTVVDLRRLHSVGADSAEPSGRRYEHRWVVRGHWRQQACGPGLSQHRPVWIMAHTKGPDGAPLLTRDRVNVWRR